MDIVRLIISMGKSLHMRIVAEGVETEEQLTSLQALGCDRPWVFNRQAESAALTNF